MRYLAGVLLLASPALADEPTYSWRSRVDEPNRTYLYRDGTQIGGWDYLTREYRPFDGKTWGPAVNAVPVPPPANRVRIVPPPSPPVVMAPPPPLPPLRGPLRRQAANIMTQVITDMTVKMIEEIPRAVVDSVKRGDFKVEFGSNVTPAAASPVAPPAEGAAAPAPAQPVRNLIRRLAAPRPNSP